MYNEAHLNCFQFTTRHGRFRPTFRGPDVRTDLVVGVVSDGVEHEADAAQVHDLLTELVTHSEAAQGLVQLSQQRLVIPEICQERRTSDHCETLRKRVDLCETLTKHRWQSENRSRSTRPHPQVQKYDHDFINETGSESFAHVRTFRDEHDLAERVLLRDDHLGVLVALPERDAHVVVVREHAQRAAYLRAHQATGREKRFLLRAHCTCSVSVSDSCGRNQSKLEITHDYFVHKWQSKKTRQSVPLSGRQNWF